MKQVDDEKNIEKGDVDSKKFELNQNSTDAKKI
jgi:hypothetical protein